MCIKGDTTPPEGEASYRKGRLLALVAHEMRNPVATISAGLKLLERLGLAESGVQVLKMMERQLAYLSHLIGDLLDVARFEEGRVSISKRPMLVADLISQAIETSRSAIDRGQHSLELVVPEDKINLVGDQQRLSQVITNLLDNAAKYTPAGGKIVLHVELQGGELLISVSDNGLGIEPDHAKQIFDMYKQLNQSDGTRQSGLGIGLYLVKMIVEAHGGAVEMLSDGAGKGSKFTVRIPCQESK